MLLREGLACILYCLCDRLPVGCVVRPVAGPPAPLNELSARGVAAVENMLAEKVCLITGSGRGIGREAALMFGDEGGKVVVSDLDREPGRTGGGGYPLPGRPGRGLCGGCHRSRFRPGHGGHRPGKLRRHRCDREQRGVHLGCGDPPHDRRAVGKDSGGSLHRALSAS